MFSSVVKSIKSIANGPRVVLANKIASVLSEHFVLDPVDIESSLLKDARIVLKNTQLRARRYRSDHVPNTVVSVKGIVEEVVFSWKWSFTGRSSTSNITGPSTYSSGSGVVQDVVLTIRGMKVQIGLDTWDTLDESEQALVENFESTLINDDSEQTQSSDSSSLRDKYLQQIVDNLTLKIEDFEFKIQAGNGPSVIITGNDLELGTLSSARQGEEDDKAKTKTRMLSQTISIGSFFVNVRGDESEKYYHLIEPFGYAASVIRLSGERFKGGIFSGLNIIGRPELHNAEDDRADEGVLFHIGPPQIQALSALGMMLVPTSSFSAESPISSEESKGIDDSQFTVEQNEDTEEAGESSIFDLPLPALTIVLPTSGHDKIPTKITLPRATVLYRADGKVFQIEGREGIKDNGTSLVTLATGGKWSVDFVKKIFDLDKDGGGCKISISDEALRRIYSSVTSLSSTDSILDLKDAWEGREDLPTDHIHEVATESWMISTGRVTLQLTGGDNNWLQANIANSSMSFSPNMEKVTEASIGGCSVRSSLDNETALTVPSFTLVSGTLHISDTIVVAVSSVEKAIRIRDFLFSFLQPSVQSNDFDNIHPSRNVPDLPSAMKLDHLRLIVRKPNMIIELKSVCGEDTSLTCEEVVYTAEQSKIRLRNINLNYLKSNVYMRIGTLLSLEIPGLFLLNEPVVDTSIVYDGKGMIVDMNKICGTFERPKSQHEGSSSSNNAKISIPFPTQFDLKYLTLKEAGESTLIQMNQIFLSASQSGSTVMVESRKGMKVRLQQSPNTSCDATLGKLSVQLQEDCGHCKLNIDSVLSLDIPGLFLLNEPVVDTSIVYDGKGMIVDMNKICGTFERPKSQHEGSGSSNNAKISIPFPTQFDLKYLTLKEAGGTTLIQMNQIFLSASQSGSTVMVESRKGLKVRLQQSPNTSCDATLGKLSVQLQEDNGYFMAKQIDHFGALVGPCSPSCGKLLISVPPMHQEGGKTLSFQKNIDISFDSVEVFENLRPLMDSIVGPQEGDPFDTFRFPVEIPGIKIFSSNPQSTIQIGMASAFGSNILCGQVHASVQNCISFSMEGLKADIISRSLNIDCVESMTLSGIAALSKQYLNLNLKLERDILYVKVPTPVHAIMLSRKTGIVPSQTVPPTQQNTINIPFQVKVDVSEANLKTLREGDETCLQVKELALDVSPIMIPTQDILSGEEKKGAKISLTMENIKHDLFQARKLHTSLMVELEDVETLHQVQISLHSPRITAGHSAIDWSSLFDTAGPNDGIQQKALKMPFAKVASTSMFISFQGKAIGSHTTIAVPEFKGDAFTSSDDLTTHYSNSVLKRMPGFLTNVNVLGTNVVDSTFANAGRLAFGASSAATAGVGSVMGTAAADGIKAAISAGKSSRNVNTNESYKFGDFSRGIARGISNAHKKGAQSRGSDGSDYIPGDFTVGAVGALGEYGGNNSERLASAGASGAAATIGLAIAGPLGFVVGGYLGGKAVGRENIEQPQPPPPQQQQQRLLPETTFNHRDRMHQQNQQLLEQQQEIPMVHAEIVMDGSNNNRLQRHLGQNNSNFYQQQYQHPPNHNRLQQHQGQTSSSPYQQQYQYPVNNNSLQRHQGQNNSSTYQQQYQHPQSSQNHPQPSSNEWNQARQYQQPQAQHQQIQQYQHHQDQYQPRAQPQQTESYKFGDVTRGILSKGKKADGRGQDSGYKFGDFTRGLFK